MHVGGLGGAWFWQVAGRPLEQIAAIDKFSKSGDLIVSTETWVLIGDKCQVWVRALLYTIVLSKVRPAYICLYFYT